MLPAPSSERWKPLRAGLVDLFYYDAEEFWFHDGRLLLRGNNGTGKSKVLALTLPFLLDGELAPHRVEPDGDRQKKMEWNLLLGGKHPHPERLGYTWLEFGRRGADGGAEFRTIGCGLKAVAGRGIARHWFFVTTQRVGVDLELLPASRVPLTREKLREEIDGQGMLYDRAADYRRAVDQALFGLGEHRYEALINLLIQLRQPQLSKKPDEKLLSRALTEALPPLSPGLITTVAEAFRGLDEERDALRALEEARGAANDFLRHYSRYAMIAAKRKAAGPRQAQGRYEQLGRELAAAEEAFSAADSQLRSSRRELEELEQQRTQLEARREALQQDPAMRDAERLEQMRDEARRRDETARIREQDRDRLAAEVQRRSVRADEAAGRAEAARDALDAAQRRAGEVAATARCLPGHRSAADGWEQDPSRARRDTQAIADRQAQAVGQLERLLAETGERRRALEIARAEEDRLTAEIQAASGRLAAAEQEAAERVRELVGAYRSYLAGLTELRVADPDELIAALEGWASTGDGANPAVSAVDDAARAAGTELGRLEAGLSARRTAHADRAGELDGEIRRLRDGGHETPPVPHTRAPGVRDARPGAPLWKVTDFAADVPDAHRAGLEAALEAAGILDAWVTPDGNLVDGDVTVVSGLAPVPGPSCASVLVPAVDSGDPGAGTLSDEKVRAVLSAIGLDGTGVTWVRTDGRWANGVLGGAWRKDSAAHIGEGAREAAGVPGSRGSPRSCSRNGGRSANLTRRWPRWRRVGSGSAHEHRAAPPDAAVRDAHTVAATDRRRRGGLHEQHARAVTVSGRRQEELNAAVARAAEFARDVRLPAEPGELAEVKGGVDAYRLALAGLWPAAEASQGRPGPPTRPPPNWPRARGAGKMRPGPRRHRGTRRLPLRRSMKRCCRPPGQRLMSCTGNSRRSGRLCGAGPPWSRAPADRSRVLWRNGAGRTESAGDFARRSRTAAATRDAAVEEFQSFAVTGVLRVALPSLEVPDVTQPWAATPAVLLARAVNAGLESIDDAEGPWDRIQKRVTEEHKLLSDAMAQHGHSAGLTLHDGIIVVDVVFQGPQPRHPRARRGTARGSRAAGEAAVREGTGDPGEPSPQRGGRHAA